MRLDDLVRENYDRMGESDHRIWQYICSHTEECRRLSLHQLAEACEVSHTTVSRFLHLIGMEGYSEFKTFLKWNSLSRPVFDQRGVEENSFHLTRTINFIQQADCTELFERMDKAEGIYAYGSGSVQKAAAKVMKNYLVLTERLLHVIEGEEERVMAVTQMKKGDIMFLFSLSGDNPVMNDYARKLKEIGIFLVAVCRDGANDLSEICDFCLPFFAQKLDVGRHGFRYYSTSGMFLIAEMLMLKYAAYQADVTVRQNI